MVRNPTSCSSNLELVGIIPPSDPSPHWPSSRVASFSPAWPLVRLVPLGSSCGYHSWRVSAPALWVMGAEYINMFKMTESRECRSSFYYSNLHVFFI